MSKAVPSAISTAIREDSGTKTEVSHDEGPISTFCLRLNYYPEKNPQVREPLASRAPRDPTFPRGIPRFSCQDLPRRLYFFGLARHYVCSTGSPEGASLATTMSSDARLPRPPLIRRAQVRVSLTD